MPEEGSFVLTCPEISVSMKPLPITQIFIPFFPQGEIWFYLLHLEFWTLPLGPSQAVMELPDFPGLN